MLLDRWRYHISRDAVPPAGQTNLPGTDADQASSWLRGGDRPAGYPFNQYLKQGPILVRQRKWDTGEPHGEEENDPR